MSESSVKYAIGALSMAIAITFVHLIIQVNSMACRDRAYVVYKPTTAIDSALITHVCN